MSLLAETSRSASRSASILTHRLPLPGYRLMIGPIINRKRKKERYLRANHWRPAKRSFLISLSPGNSNFISWCRERRRRKGNAGSAKLQSIRLFPHFAARGFISKNAGIVLIFLSFIARHLFENKPAAAAYLSFFSFHFLFILDQHAVAAKR